ncbi:hypothetical protein VdG1_00867 [Verticillium dahliae VDG1]|nr:hypothetical protein VdG1_00867 [Verticillium dahliae VDG1]
MAEVVFARQFLSTLDSKPIKLSADHVEDPKNFPARPPYVLPKMPKAFSKPAAPLAPGQERSVTVVLKSLRNPPIDAFWADLKGFLMQRLKDEAEAEKLAASWHADWASKR